MDRNRMLRSIVLGGAALTTGGMFTVICGSCGSGDEVAADSGYDCGIAFLSSTCGITSTTTTCGQLVSCTEVGAQYFCQVGSCAKPVTSSCTITVVLADGTQHTVAFTPPGPDTNPYEVSCASDGGDASGDGD